MRLHEISQCTNVQVIAVPVMAQDPHLQLVSINQYDNLGKNGYKQFNISLENEAYDQINSPCLKDISKNVSNLSLITVLSIRKHGLRSLPISVHCLPLKELDLQRNALEHIPECLYVGLKDIERLNLSENFISHFPLPNCYQSLKTLSLDSCRFTNLPEWILQMKCRNLEELSYSKNKQVYLRRLDDPILPVKINKLIFSSSQLYDNNLGFFKTFHLLQYLDITDIGLINRNYINDINALFKNPLWYNHIQVLKLNNLGISELSEDFFKLPKLQELHIRQNTLWNVSESICSMNELVVLDISSNCLYDLPHLDGLVKLRELRAAHNYLSHVSIGYLPVLSYLDLYNNDLQHVQLDTTIMALIDLDQNCVDPEVLSNVDNYVEKREALRRGLSPIELGFYGQRCIGRKLVRPETPPSLEDSYQCYSDLSDEELEFSPATSVESQNGETVDNHDDDWGDSLSKNDLVTLSDSEFIPDDDNSNVAAVKEDVETNNLELSFEKLFIDAD